MEAKKNVSKHVDNHLFCSFCDYILDLCDELCLARTRRYTSRNTFLRLHYRLCMELFFVRIIVFVVLVITLSIVYF